MGLIRALVAALCALVVAAPLAAGADPLVAQQEWLPRVVPPGLLPPAGPIPPIAIIESGVDTDHPDLAGGWLRVRRATPLPDRRNRPEMIGYLEGVAHGTAVASVIGAPRDGVGMEGVLPGARVWVYGGDGTCRDTALAIRRAVDDGARIINASYGFSRGGQCLQHRDATSYAFGNGALVVAAAGNGRPQQPWIQPGNDFHVLTVAALNAHDQPTGFSFQKLYTDIAAPGEGVLVAVPAWADREDGAEDGYARWDGTSFSAPMVAAAAAWVLAVRPRLTADQLAEVLRASARDLGRPGWDIATGSGALDLRAALSQPAPRHDAYEPNDDIRWVDGRGPFRADPPLLRARRADVVRARLDAIKDPVDVYPVRVPAGARVVVRLRPAGMRMDLYAWGPWARTAFGGGGNVIAKSRRAGLAVETIRMVNTGNVARTAWVEVRAVRGGALAGGYALRLRR